MPWVGGYLEFRDELWQPHYGLNTAPEPPPPPKFHCRTESCGLIFLSQLDLEIHEMRGHSGQVPSMLFRGRQLGRTRRFISSKCSPTDWQIMNAVTAKMNQVVIEATEIPHTLSNIDDNVCFIELSNQFGTVTFELEFLLAAEEDLLAVDDALLQLMRRDAIGRAEIDDFSRRALNNSTAIHYASGITHYLNGYLEREGLSEGQGNSSQNRSIHEYNLAVDKLSSFDRLTADTICALINFHYNQFEQARLRTRCNRVSVASNWFLKLMSDEPLPPSYSWKESRGISEEQPGFDHRLSDTVTDSLLEAVSRMMQPREFSRTNPQELSIGIESLDIHDAAKFQLLNAEWKFAVGHLEEALRHANRLEHNAAFSKWHTKFLQRLERT